ncbi:MAG TPA: alpha/beta hydrolase [Myxococcota bacterium]|nr:alpha/beta hydrolase [Myxococcota bacterium]
MDRYSETTVTAGDGTPIWYRSIGSLEPTLVLNDGIGCDGFVWKYIVPHFETSHRIIHWNYRGHGKSGAPENLDNLGIEECAEDLKIVLDDAGVTQPAVLLGHSMGVQVILEFYHRYPDRVCALVPVTGSYGRAIDHIHDSGLGKKILPLAGYLADNFKPVVGEVWRHLVHSELAFQYASIFEINGRLNKREDFFPYLEHLSRMDPVVFMRTLEGAARHTAEPYLADIKVPTLIVAGEKDRFTPYWISRRMHTLTPDSELLTLPMCSHTGPIELPELVNLGIEKFMARLQSADEDH